MHPQPRQNTAFSGLTRGYEALLADSYRFGFNGQERTDEIAGTGNHNTALYWEYDTRLGRRWNVDPVVKPWESSYAVMGNNPIWKIDPNGEDFVNFDTKRKEAAKEKRDEAAGRLDAAKKAFEPFKGMSKSGAKKIGQLSEFKEARSDLNSAQMAFDRPEGNYQQEVFFEGVVRQILNDFLSVNPEKFAEWDKFNPTGRGVIDIDVSVQNVPIQLLDNLGNAKGSTTTEGINALIGSFNNDYIKIRLQVIRVEGIIKIQAVISDLVHGLGHVDVGKHRDENYSVDYEIKNYVNLLRKDI